MSAFCREAPLQRRVPRSCDLSRPYRLSSNSELKTRCSKLPESIWRFLVKRVLGRSQGVKTQGAGGGLPVHGRGRTRRWAHHSRCRKPARRASSGSTYHPDRRSTAVMACLASPSTEPETEESE